MQFYLILTSLLFTFSTASLHSQFRHFEKIFPHDIKVRHKRSSNLLTKLVQFDILGNNFHIHLFPDSSILSPKFEVHLIDAVGKRIPATVNRDGIYTGHEKDNVENKVKAVQHNDLWYFYIRRPEDNFVIEPLSRLDPQTSGKQLIAYRSSDIVNNRTKHHQNNEAPFCKATRDMFRSEKETSFRKRSKRGDLKLHPKRFTKHKVADGLGNDELESRQRRATNAADTCDVFMVVDYRTFKGVGKGSPQAIIKWLSHIMQLSDDLFRKSGLELDGTTFGVRLVGLYIHKEFTKVESGKTHYNMEHNIDSMNDEDTLIDFMSFPWHQKFCLAHLVTQRTFGHSGDVLGVATIASESWDNHNGICMNTGRYSSRNGGLTTPISAGYPLSTHDYVITLSHEFGHNFGAEHDNAACSPSSDAGGKYLMYAYSGALKGANSMKFSPGCSIPKLRGVMKAKAHKCFRSKEEQKDFCGDGLLSDKEDCDAGINTDRCCTSKCRFRTGAVCSPHHHPCCTADCQLAPDIQTCINDLGNECARESKCDGVDAFTCPIPTLKPNGAVCGENGTCWNGQCFSFCQNLGRLQEPPRDLHSCNCEESPESMCQFCCMDLGSPGEGSCKKMGGARRDGSPCLRGTCQSGVCSSAINDTLSIGQMHEAIQVEKHGRPNYTFVSVIIVVILSVMGVIGVGMLVVTKAKDEETRQFSKEDEAVIEELRLTLQEAIGHLNVSPDDDEDPTALAIKAQLAKERKRKQSVKNVKNDFD